MLRIPRRNRTQGPPRWRDFPNAGVVRLTWCVEDELTCRLVQRYVALLDLPTDQLRITTSRSEFESWLGRRVRSSIGGAYAYSPRRQEHLVLINLPRINQANPKSLEVVVAEELIHMRDRLDGDLRRHAKHGYDRIAHRVALLTGSTLEEVRDALLPAERRPPKYLYACPACGMEVPRRTKGTWSCGRCSSRFDRRFVLALVGS